jgi:hypothetical protein
MVLQAPRNDALRLLHRGAMPRVQERKGRYLLPSARITLAARLRNIAQKGPLGACSPPGLG